MMRLRIGNLDSGAQTMRDCWRLRKPVIPTTSLAAGLVLAAKTAFDPNTSQAADMAASTLYMRII